MKFLSIPFLLLFLSVVVFSNAQSQEKDTRPLTLCNVVADSNLICDSLFTFYTGLWTTWWTNSISPNPLSGNPDNAYFTISGKDLDWVKTLATNPDSIELFYALTRHRCKHKPSRLTALAFPEKHQCRFKKDTARWHKWLEPRLKGTSKNIPVGVKVGHTDLQDLYTLIKCSDVTSINGYFGFHHPADQNLNQMVVIFRPVFQNNPIRKKNHEIICNNTPQTGTNSQTSSININFTNPCPPCNNTTQ
jgi:hypothetical protein